jgi:mannose-6-phosphate isomerase-like protein (cupin superfamily)
MSKPVEPRIIGEHVRRLRLKRHASVRAFAAQTGFSPSFISQLENGQVSPSLGSMQKIAEALGSMTRARRLEPVLATFGIGGRSGKQLHSHPHEEFAFVLKGTVTLTLGDEESELEPGDGVTLPAHSPHRWENRGRQAVEVLMVASRLRG